MEQYPTATAPAIDKPRAADFPRPRAANKATVLRSVLSKIASRNVTTAFPCIQKSYKNLLTSTTQKLISSVRRK